VSSIGGRALGGVLAAKFGAAFAYALDAVSFAASLVSLWLLAAAPAAANARRASLSSVVEGLRYARSRKELLATYLIDLNAMFFGMPMALFPAMAEGFGPGWVGWFYAMPAVGAFCASFTSGWTKYVNRQGLAITVAAGLWGLAIVAFGLAGNLWWALFFLALAGAADEISAIFRVTMWNESIPDHLRGRLASIEMLSYLSGPKLGDAEAGLMASLFSVRTSVVSGGVLCVAGSVLLALLMPAFLRYDGREGRLRKQLEEEIYAAATETGS
jgi:MFS family permease